MEKLEKRVNVELEQWPDHAVLNDVSFKSFWRLILRFKWQIYF